MTERALIWYITQLSDDFLWYLILRGKQKEKTKSHRIQSSYSFSVVGTIREAFISAVKNLVLLQEIEIDDKLYFFPQYLFWYSFLWLIIIILPPVVDDDLFTNVPSFPRITIRTKNGTINEIIVF